MSSSFDWFCGHEESQDNASRTSITVVPDDTCTINAIIVIFHIVFIVVSSLILAFCSCVIQQHTPSFYLHKFPAHTFRWLLLVLYLLICVFSIGEGIVTDQTFQQITTTQPQLYLPAIFTAIGTIFSLIFYHHCESWRGLRLLNVLLVYWLLGFVAEALKLQNLHSIGSSGITIARYDLSIINLVFYLTLSILEIYLQCSPVSKLWNYY